ncbi:MAG: DUF3343 domain-containing protein [bacterium]|nr:DUF3343 domain-containing protein [bacterium]
MKGFLNKIFDKVDSCVRKNNSVGENDGAGNGQEASDGPGADKSNLQQQAARGLLIFSNTTEVIRAEEILKSTGYQIRVVSPPAQYRTGCDLAIDFPLVEQVGIIRCLKEEKIVPIDVLPLSAERLEPLRLCRITDFGDYLMVKAANMKITFHKLTWKIVNISGGGCPDVPYLAAEMIGKRLPEAPHPKKLGYTLCAYSLSVAYEEALRIMEEQRC